MMYSSNKLHFDLNILKCKDLHKFAVSLFVYKQLNGGLPNIFRNYFVINSTRCNRLTRQSNNLYLPQFRTNSGQKSLKYIGAKLWNDICPHIKQSNSVYIFKKLFKKSLIDSYNS